MAHRSEKRACREVVAKSVLFSYSVKLVKDRKLGELKGAKLFDYAARDDFAVLNAVPTAEGALECAMSAYEGTIAGSRALVVGFGRIGKVLARLLKAVGADVTVSARNTTDAAYIRALGYRFVNTEELREIRGYDLVFNTVPARIFNEELLKNTDRHTLLTDLASLPGGVDFEAASALRIDAQRALSLPGKCAPESAGIILGQTVHSILHDTTVF